MVDFLLEDVKALILKEKGDPEVLKGIQRACERGEVISVHEKDYVQQLAEQFLGKKSKFRKEENLEDQIPKTEQNLSSEKPKPTNPTTITTKTKLIQKKPSIQKSHPLLLKGTESKRAKTFVGIGAFGLAIILILAISQTELSNTPSGPSISAPSTQSTTNLIINTDRPSYDIGDIISISGNSKLSLGLIVNLSIKSPDEEVIWEEEVNIKNSGQYSTLVIAGGEGWEKPGIYILKAEHGTQIEEISFSLNS